MITTKEMKLINIEKLVSYVNNARTHSKEQTNKLRSSIREFGKEYSYLEVVKDE